MKATLLLCALLVVPAIEASAQTRAAGLGPRITLPSRSNHFSWEHGHGFKRGFPGVWIVEREVPVVVEKEVVREVAVPTPSPVSGSNRLGDGSLPGTPEGEGKKRKPYVIGSTYASLPSGCMKMVELAASYYFCGGGEWYQQVGEGPSARYKAVARKL